MSDNHDASHFGERVVILFNSVLGPLLPGSTFHNFVSSFQHRLPCFRHATEEDDKVEFVTQFIKLHGSGNYLQAIVSVWFGLEIDWNQSFEHRDYYNHHLGQPVHIKNPAAAFRFLDNESSDIKKILEKSILRMDARCAFEGYRPMHVCERFAGSPTLAGCHSVLDLYFKLYKSEMESFDDVWMRNVLVSAAWSGNFDILKVLLSHDPKWVEKEFDGPSGHCHMGYRESLVGIFMDFVEYGHQDFARHGPQIAQNAPGGQNGRNTDDFRLRCEQIKYLFDLGCRDNTLDVVSYLVRNYRPGVVAAGGMALKQLLCKYYCIPETLDVIDCGMREYFDIMFNHDLIRERHYLYNICSCHDTPLMHMCDFDRRKQRSLAENQLELVFDPYFVQKFLSKKAVLDSINELQNGKTALDMAVSSVFQSEATKEIIKLLIENGAKNALQAKQEGRLNSSVSQKIAPAAEDAKKDECNSIKYMHTSTEDVIGETEDNGDNCNGEYKTYTYATNKTDAKNDPKVYGKDREVKKDVICKKCGKDVKCSEKSKYSKYISKYKKYSKSKCNGSGRDRKSHKRSSRSSRHSRHRYRSSRYSYYSSESSVTSDSSDTSDSSSVTSTDSSSTSTCSEWTRRRRRQKSRRSDKNSRYRRQKTDKRNRRDRRRRNKHSRYSKKRRKAKKTRKPSKRRRVKRSRSRSSSSSTSDHSDSSTSSGSSSSSSGPERDVKAKKPQERDLKKKESSGNKNGHNGANEESGDCLKYISSQKLQKSTTSVIEHAKGKDWQCIDRDRSDSVYGHPTHSGSHGVGKQLNILGTLDAMDTVGARGRNAKQTFCPKLPNAAFSAASDVYEVNPKSQMNAMHGMDRCDAYNRFSRHNNSSNCKTYGMYGSYGFQTTPNRLQSNGNGLGATGPHEEWYRSTTCTANMASRYDTRGLVTTSAVTHTRRGVFEEQNGSIIALAGVARPALGLVGRKVTCKFDDISMQNQGKTQLKTLKTLETSGSTYVPVPRVSDWKQLQLGQLPEQKRLHGHQSLQTQMMPIVSNGNNGNLANAVNASLILSMPQIPQCNISATSAVESRQVLHASAAALEIYGNEQEFEQKYENLTANDVERFAFNPEAMEFEARGWANGMYGTDAQFYGNEGYIYDIDMETDEHDYHWVDEMNGMKCDWNKIRMERLSCLNDKCGDREQTQ